MANTRASRKHIRKVTQFSVRVRVLSSAQCPSGEVPGIAGTATSISEGGLGFETNLPLAAGDELQIAFILPGEKQKVVLEATVQSVRAAERTTSDPNQVTIGLKFKNVAPQTAVYLTNYMSGTFLLY